jgi:hypothetical protein
LTLKNAQQPLGDLPNKHQDLKWACYFCERCNIAVCSIADDNLLYKRLLEANNLTSLAVGDNTQGSIQISNKSRKLTVFCCGRVASHVIGTSCENCFDPNVQVTAINTARSKNPTTAEELSKGWGIGEEKARNTLKVTTQLGICQVKHPVGTVC